MRLYFLLFITAVCFFDDQNWNKNSYLLSRLSAAGRMGSCRRLLAYEFKRKGMKHGMKMIWTAKIRKLNEEMTPHCLILSCLPRMHVSFVYVPPPPLSPPSPPPLPRQRTDGVKVKGGVTVRSSPLPSSSATSCFAVSYFYSVDYSVKHCFLSPIFKKVFR